MNARLALAVAIALAALSPRADADGDATGEVVVAAVAAPADDVRKAVLVGPSGQVWEPDGQGTWTRRAAGGIAADVRGAAVAGASLVVAGKATPLYRRDGDRWFAMRLGERGRTTIGRGPRASLAIGRLVFVWNGTSWKRVAVAPGVVTATWAASETKVVIATDGGVWRLVGGAFRPVATTPVTAIDGAAAWAAATDGTAFDVAGRRAHRPTVAGQPMTVTHVTAAGDSTWVLGTTAAGPALARWRKGAWSEAIAPPLTADDPAVALAADATGAVLVVTRGGSIHLAAAEGTWVAGTRTQALPPATGGPGPARVP